MNRKLVALVISCLMLVLLAPGLDIPSVIAAQYWSDGFESGTKDAWTSTTGTIDVSVDHPYTGSYGATVPSLGTADEHFVSKTQAHTELYFCCRYYFHDLTLPSETWPSLSRFRIMSIEVDGVNGISLLVSRGSPTNYWKVQYGDYEFSDSIETLAPAAGNWYGIELHWNNTGGTQKTWEVWVNGTNIFSLTGTDTYSSTTTNVQLGAWDYDGDNTPTIVTFFDDAVTGDAYLGCPPVGGPTPDTDPPTYENDADYTSNIAGDLCNFSITINDNVDVSGYILSVMNNTFETWYNNSWFDCVDASSVLAGDVFILPNDNYTETDTLITKYRFYANDTTNNWSASNIFETIALRTTYDSLSATSMTSGNNPAGIRRVTSVTSGSSTAVLMFNNALDFIVYYPSTHTTYVGNWSGYLPNDAGNDYTVHSVGSTIRFACWHGYNNITHSHQNYAYVAYYKFVSPCTLVYNGASNLVNNATLFIGDTEGSTFVYNSYWLPEFPGTAIIYGYYSFAFATAMNGHTTVAIKCNGDFSFELSRLLLYDLSDGSYVMTQLGASTVIGATPIALATDPYYTDGYVVCFSYRATQLVKYRRWTGAAWHEFIPSITEENMGTTNDHAWSITYSASANRTYFAGSSVGIYHLANSDNTFVSDSVSVYGTVVCIGATQSQVIVLQIEDAFSTSCITQTVKPALSSWSYVNLFYVNSTASVMCPAISIVTAKLPCAFIKTVNSYSMTVFEFGSTNFFAYLDADLEGCGNWVFADNRYYTFNLTFYYDSNASTLDVTQLRFTLPTKDGNIVTTCVYHDGNWTVEFLPDVEERSLVPVRVENSITSVSIDEFYATFLYKIWFTTKCLDVYEEDSALDVSARTNATNGDDSGWIIAGWKFFRIYSKGGFTMNYTTIGDAGKVQGEDVFSFYARNNSYVYRDMVYRDLAHVKMLPQIQCIVNRSTFYLRYGIDYCTQDEDWQSGWSFVFSPRALTFQGGFWIWTSGTRWVNATMTWYNRDSSVKTGDVVYMFHRGNAAADGEITNWRMWIDLWFNTLNASSTGGGRLNAYEYAMTDNANPWLKWLSTNWGPLDSVPKESMCFVPLLDGSGNIMPSEKIKLVRIWCSLEVPASAQAQEVWITNYEVFDKTFSDYPLRGIQTPVFDETTVPLMPQGGFLGVLAATGAWWGKWISDNILWGGLSLWPSFVAFMDSIAAWLGYPGLFSGMIAWLVSAWGWFTAALGYMSAFAPLAFSFATATFSKLLTLLTDAVTYWTQMIQTFDSFMNGTYTAGLNIWVDFNIPAWITLGIILYPIYLLILWEEDGMDAMLMQLTFIWNVLAVIGSSLIKIAQFIQAIIGRIVESIPVVE